MIAGEQGWSIKQVEAEWALELETQFLVMEDPWVKKSGVVGSVRHGSRVFELRLLMNVSLITLRIDEWRERDTSE